MDIDKIIAKGKINELILSQPMFQSLLEVPNSLMSYDSASHIEEMLTALLLTTTICLLHGRNSI